ncbi:MAG: molybdopterin-synthase adenylyltransferase MoeB [Gammaproteobacteria bacterium]|jgi:molybdopterin/thiamine biosynthesis adenylyltransferase
MNDQQLLRYSRHIVLDGFDTVGQERLLNSHVLVVGVGGLGSPVATYLASAGVGQMTICDFDEVDLSNLQRQIIHRETRIGMNKALSAKIELEEINPDCRINPVVDRLDSVALDQLVASVDVVVDASDNFETRHAVNRACIKHAKPLVSGTAINYVGQIAVFDLRDASSPCYACFVPEDSFGGVDRCSTSGVLAPLTGTIGSMQATEVINLLVAGRSGLSGRALLYDARDSEWSQLPVVKNPNCTICVGKPERSFTSPR